MASCKRVHNVTRDFYWKKSKAERAIEECSAAWVVPGVSVRDLTVQESIAARNEQARLAEPLALAELHGLTFEPPAYAVAGARMSRILARQAMSMVQA